MRVHLGSLLDPQTVARLKNLFHTMATLSLVTDTIATVFVDTANIATAAASATTTMYTHHHVHPPPPLPGSYGRPDESNQGCGRGF